MESMPWLDLSVEKQRRDLVEAVLARREPVSVICRRFQVSRQTAYKFCARFRADGGAGLRDRRRAPLHACAKQAPRWREIILRLRHQQPSWGAHKLRWLLGEKFGRRNLPSARTIQRWLVAAGLIRRKVVRRRLRPTRLIRALQPRRHQSVWTIDLKGWFHTTGGFKVEPLTVRDLWSRFILCTSVLEVRNERSVRLVCQRLFRRYGRPKAIRCDRGGLFFGDGPHGFTRLSLWWWRLGIRVEFVRRGQIDNNAHEQMHRVLKAETVIGRTKKAQVRNLEKWRQRYNYHRPHAALGMQPPARLFRARPAQLPTLRAPRYPRHWLKRFVATNGKIFLPGWHGSIGRAFGGQRVGLAPAGARRYRIYFARLYLGTLELNRSRTLIMPAF